MTRLGASTGNRVLDLTPKVLDQRGQAGLARRRAGELLGVLECRGEISGIAAEAHERKQRIAIARMAGHARLESRNGIRDMPGRMQPDGINIRISCSLGIELRGAAPFVGGPPPPP